MYRVVWILSLWLVSVGRANPACLPFYQVEKVHIQTLKSRADVEKTLREVVRSARESIQIEVSTFRDLELGNSIVEKAKSGVAVTLILPDIKATRSENEVKKGHIELAQKITEAGGHVTYASPNAMKFGSSVVAPELHRKIVVVDSEYALMMTSNINFWANNQNLDVGVLISGPIVKSLQRVFERDEQYFSEQRFWPLKTIRGGGFEFTDGSDQTHFDFFKASILSAEKEISLSSFEISDPRIIDLLLDVKKKKPNLKVRVLTGPISRARFLTGSIRLNIPSNAQIQERLKGSGIEIKEWVFPNSYNHTRVMIVDGKTTWISSADLSIRGLYGNAEFSTRFLDTVLSGEFQTEFDSWWKNGMNRQVSGAEYLAELSIRQAELYYVKLQRMTLYRQRFKDLFTDPTYRDLALKRGGMLVKKIFGVSAQENGIDTLFVGFGSNDKEASIERELYRRSGRFGEGIYLTNNYHLAEQYSLSSSLRKHKDAVVFIVSPKGKLKFFDYFKDLDDYKVWVRAARENGRLGPHEANSYLKKYCEFNGYQGVLFKNADREGDINVVIYDHNLLDLMHVLNIKEYKKAAAEKN